MRVVKKIIIFIFELGLAGLAAWLLFNLALVFGHQILDQPSLVGNDSDFALSLVSWFGRWWPRIPLWFPLQGAGVSMFHSYPMLNTFLIIWLEKITSYSGVEIFRLVSFMVFPLTAFGIYVLARRKIGNSVAAFFAGVFFLLSQASWVFQRLHGIAAQSFSLIFVPWSFLFFDIFLVRRATGKGRAWLTRLAMILAVLATTLCFLAHVVTGTVVAMSLVAYTVVYWQLKSPFRAGFKKRFGYLFRSLFWSLFVVGLGFSLGAFWLIPFFSYNRLANREGLLNMGMSQLREVSLLPQTLLGFGNFRTGDLRYDYFFFALPVIILAAIGLTTSLFRKKSVFAWSAVGFGMALFTALPLYLAPLVALFKYIFTAVYFRALTVTIILLPVSAGFGAFFLVDLPFWAAGLLRKRRNTSKVSADFALKVKGKSGGKNISGERQSFSREVARTAFDLFRWLVASVGVLVVSLFFINRFEHRPPDESTRAHPAYGIEAFKAYGPSLGEDVKVLRQDWSLLWRKREIKISSEGPRPAPSLSGFIKDFSLDRTSRVDVSAYSGEGFLQRAPLVTEATFVNLYHYFASLIHRMWGYQQGVFYGHEGLYDNPELLRDLSYWFGIKYTTLVPGFDREENFLKVGWEMVKPRGPNNPLPVYHFPEAEGLLTVSERPAALVIGDFGKEAYDHVFRSGNAGAFSYHDLWLVEGGAYVDDYSLRELEDFDLLILHGYRYHDKSNAWATIDRFVRGGGRLFVDTGWQYLCPDWGSKNGGGVVLREPAPVMETTWGEISPQWDSLEISPLLGSFETREFKPFLWEGSSWGAAIAKESDLSERAEALIKDKKGIVLARREVGSGRIVWSGLNLFSHAQGAEGEKEIELIRAIFDWLNEGKRKDYGGVTWQRDFPDELTATFSEAAEEQWFLWREAFTPKWFAYIKTPADKQLKELKIYRGGPGFVLIRLPPVGAGDVLKLEYRLGWFEGGFAWVISGLTALFLVGYLLIGGRVETKVDGGFGKKLGQRWEKVSKSIARKEEEDY
ncbi:MAG: hypothetical protein JW991_05575 [Candidatus Pacebacteria bacterium]|nr:hypothetical protein [Candidatus Paceibacterota bacterium]